MAGKEGSLYISSILSQLILQQEKHFAILQKTYIVLCAICPIAVT